MRMKRTTAAFALLVCLSISVPASAIGRDDDPMRGVSPIQRVIHLIKRIVRTFDEVSIPKP